MQPISRTAGAAGAAGAEGTIVTGVTQSAEDMQTNQRTAGNTTLNLNELPVLKSILLKETWDATINFLQYFKEDKPAPLRNFQDAILVHRAWAIRLKPNLPQNSPIFIECEKLMEQVDLRYNISARYNASNSYCEQFDKLGGNPSTELVNERLLESMKELEEKLDPASIINIRKSIIAIYSKFNIVLLAGSSSHEPIKTAITTWITEEPMLIKDLYSEASLIMKTDDIDRYKFEAPTLENLIMLYQYSPEGDVFG